MVVDYLFNTLKFNSKTAEFVSQTEFNGKHNYVNNNYVMIDLKLKIF